MRKAIIFFILFTLLLPLVDFRSATRVLAANSLPAVPEKISADLQSRLDALAPEETITVIVTLLEQADLSQIPGADRAARQTGVITALQAVAKNAQRPIQALLASHQAQGRVARVVPFWVFNGFSVTATRQVIQELAARPDVYQITADAVDIIPTGPLDVLLPEANIALVNAPALWSMGFYGQGVVVANMDSGVDASHPDLASRYRGGSNSWFDPYAQHATPYDMSGHGTQTMGLMVGGDAGGSSIGVAPQAQWVAVKIFNDAGSATSTAIHQGYQWLLDPDGNPLTADAPQVVNNSWSFSIPGCNLEYQLDLQALRAANIIPVFSAGNFGPYPNTSASPANNPEAFAVGAVNNLDQIDAYSSRGSSSCGEPATVFPELVAPGVDVKSTDRYGFYTYASGTSLAAPHVSGALALLLSAHPSLPASLQQSALLNGALDLGLPGPDNDYGYGRLDILASYQWLQATLYPGPTPFPPPPSPTPSPTPLPLPSPTATPLPQPPAMHIGDIDGSAAKVNRKGWTATVTLVVHDASDNPLANATVSGSWSGAISGTASCLTGSSGSCQIKSSTIKSSYAQVTFTVTNVTLASAAYAPAANHDPDGDSNGTRIIVKRP